jgi:hypothetical protein
MKYNYLAYIIIIGISLSSYKTNAQSNSTTKSTSPVIGIDTITNNIGKAITDANNMKTGNWQDVLSNFFQIGLSDLTGPNKAFNFSSSLFALKLKTSPSLNVDTEYIRHNFDRNFQFNFSLKLDSQYNFNGFSGGLTWAAINKRDTTLISLINSDIDKVWQSNFTKLDKLIRQYRVLRDPHHLGKDSVFNHTDSMINRMMKLGKFSIDSFPGVDSLPKIFNFRDSLNNILKSGLNNVYSYYDSVKQSTLLKPLLTFSLNGAVNKQSKFDSAQVGAVYLQGLTKSGKPLELDIRMNLGFKDTLINKDNYRTVFNSSAGLNYAIITNKKTNNSILEIKPYFEYDKIISGLLPGENVNKFLANVDLRFRITQNLWIPFTIKYDIKNGNFLGFLNIALNITALKSLIQGK